jgi:hypothetical protein
MAKYRKKPVVIEATEWFKDGDHPSVEPYPATGTCPTCERFLQEHGWVYTLEGHHIVCPGDFIITGVNGEKYPCKPDIFAKTYELVEDQQ